MAMKQLVNFLQSLNLTLCMAAGMLVALGVVMGMTAVVRRKTEDTRRAEGKAAKGRAAEVTPLVVFGVLAMLLVWAVAGELGRENRATSAYRDQYRKFYGPRSECLKAGYHLAAERLRVGSRGMDPVIAKAEEDGIPFGPIGPVPEIPEELLDLLRGVNRGGTALSAMTWLLWLALGWGLLRAGRTFAMANPTGTDMKRRSRSFVGLAGVGFLLAGVATYRAGKIDRAEFLPWTHPRFLLAQGLEQNESVGLLRPKVEKMIALAEQRETRQGYPPISAERKEAFLKATAGLAKANIYLPRGPGVPLPNHQAEAYARRVMAVESLIYQAGYRGNAWNFDPEQVVPPLLEALKESGIAPGAKESHSTPGGESFRIELDIVPWAKPE